MSRPRTPPASFSRLPASFCSRSAALRAVSGAESAGHHDHAVVVGHDDVARVDERAGHDDRHVDRAGGGLHRSLRGDRARPHREVHRGQLRDVADAGVDDDADRALGAQRGREQLADRAVGGWARRRDDQDVAGPHLLHGRVDHEVVAGMAEHRDRAAGDAAARVDRAQVGGEHAGAALRLVRGRHAHAGQCRDGVGVGESAAADDDVAHRPSAAPFTRTVDPIVSPARQNRSAVRVWSASTVSLWTVERST